MNFNKYDLVETSKNKVDDKRIIYIIVANKKDNGYYIASKIIITQNKKSEKQWHLPIDNGDDKLLIKYDYFSALPSDNLIKSNYELNYDKYKLVNEIYELKNSIQEELKLERKKRRIEARNKTRERNYNSKVWRKKEIIPGEPSMKGIHDANYKGNITIVRG